MRILTILTALVLTAALSGCAGRNIHRELRDDPNVLVRQWTLETRGPSLAGDRGYEFSNPVFFENTLIFGSRTVGVISLYPGLQAKRWTLPIMGGVVSEILVEGKSLYFGGGDGFLYSVDAETGHVNWRYDLHNPTVSRPTFVGGRLFVTSTDDTIYAFDAGTGKWLWHYRRRNAALATIHGASPPLVDGSEVLAGLSDGFLVVLNVNDGSLKWERKLSTGVRFTDVDAEPKFDHGTLYVPSYDGALYALNRKDGAILWRFDAGGSKKVVIEDDKLYLPSTDGAIYALSKESSKVLWKFDLDGGVPTQLVVTDRYVIVGSSYQYLYVIDKSTGKGVYRYNVGYGSGFSGSPAYDAATHRLYFLSGAGNLYSFSVTPPAPSRPRGSVEPYSFP